LANERCVLFFDFRLDNRIHGAVKLGHGCFLSATLIAPGGSGVLLFPTEAAEQVLGDKAN
jgi:hypothetical protein